MIWVGMLDCVVVDNGDLVRRDVLGGTNAVVHVGAVTRRSVRNCFIMVL